MLKTILIFDWIRLTPVVSYIKQFLRSAWHARGSATADVVRHHQRSRQGHDILIHPDRIPKHANNPLTRCRRPQRSKIVEPFFREKQKLYYCAVRPPPRSHQHGGH